MILLVVNIKQGTWICTGQNNTLVIFSTFPFYFTSSKQTSVMVITTPKSLNPSWYNYRAEIPESIIVITMPKSLKLRLSPLCSGFERHVVPQAAQATGGGERGGGGRRAWSRYKEMYGNYFVMIAINNRICHEIQNKRIVPVSDSPLYPLCWSKVATTTIVVEILCGVSPSKRLREGWKNSVGETPPVRRR